MALCIYCGTENPDGRDTCSRCSHSLVRDDPVDDQFLPVREPPDVSQIDLHTVFEDGFGHPDWRKVFEDVKRMYPTASDRQPVWHEIAKRWLQELKENLGGTYRCYESDHFFLLAAEGKGPSHTLLSYLENSLAAIRRLIEPLMVRFYRKSIVLAFSEPDDYYAYISHFHQEGEHIQTSGIFVHRGWMHIAFPFNYVFSSKQVITHELVHHCIARLPVPGWIHEGLAQRLEHLIIERPLRVDRELVERHYAHWNETNIQDFWSGDSFHQPGNSSELSYSLAEILATNLSGNWNDFLAFVQAADYRDAGQDAALKILGRCLGDVAGEFLGPGEWRPLRKKIAERFERRRKESSPPNSMRE